MSDSPDSPLPFSEQLLLITPHLAPGCHCPGLLDNLLFIFYISSQQNTGNTEMICSNKKPRLRRQVWTFIMWAGQRARRRQPAFEMFVWYKRTLHFALLQCLVRLRSSIEDLHNEQHACQWSPSGNLDNQSALVCPANWTAQHQVTYKTANEIYFKRE